MLYSIVRLLPFDHLDLPVFPVIKLHKCRPLYPHLIFHISHKNLWLNCHGLYENMGAKIQWTAIVSPIQAAINWGIPSSFDKHNWTLLVLKSRTITKHYPIYHQYYILQFISNSPLLNVNPHSQTDPRYHTSGYVLSCSCNVAFSIGFWCLNQILPNMAVWSLHAAHGAIAKLLRKAATARLRRRLALWLFGWNLQQRCKANVRVKWCGKFTVIWDIFWNSFSIWMSCRPETRGIQWLVIMFWLCGFENNCFVIEQIWTMEMHNYSPTHVKRHILVATTCLHNTSMSSNMSMHVCTRLLLLGRAWHRQNTYPHCRIHIKNVSRSRTASGGGKAARCRRCRAAAKALPKASLEKLRRLMAWEACSQRRHPELA
jgi:hypothetical protein